MPFHPALGIVAMNFKYFCRLKSVGQSSIFRLGHLETTRSTHSLFRTNALYERNKPSTLFSSIIYSRSASNRTRKRVDPPVDYLPFSWERKKKFDYIEESGDTIRSLNLDPSLPKHSLDIAETLKDIDDDVRKQFTLETGTKADLNKINKELFLKKVQQHPVDFNSREVQIALETFKVLSRLHQVKEVFKRSRKWKVLLLHSIQKRNKKLKELRNVDLPRFEWIIKELGIEYTPPPLAVERLPYSRKNDLRQLTKNYCDNLINEKRTAYHAELKEQQKKFLKEKEEILAWIAKEEKELGIAKSDNDVS